jgi:hypothetical protein
MRIDFYRDILAGAGQNDHAAEKSTNVFEATTKVEMDKKMPGLFQGGRLRPGALMRAIQNQ